VGPPVRPEGNPKKAAGYIIQRLVDPDYQALN
jgi:hypothetical protein